MATLIKLNDHIKIAEFEEGIALFDSFTQDTHFVYKPNSLLFALLNSTQLSIEDIWSSLAKSELAEDVFEQILEEALASGILVETQSSAS